MPIPRPNQSCWEPLAGRPLRIHVFVSEDLSLGYLLHVIFLLVPFWLPVAMVTICKCLDKSGYQHYWAKVHLFSPFWDTQWVLFSNLTGRILFPCGCHILSSGTTLSMSFYVPILLWFSFPSKLSLLRTQAEVNPSVMALGHSSVSLMSVLGISSSLRPSHGSLQRLSTVLHRDITSAYCSAL